MDKEEIKARRKEAYQQAKKQREEDPSYQAMKEKAKAMRKEQYQAFKKKIKDSKQQAKKARQAERDEELAKALGLFEQLRLLKFDQ